MTERWGRADLHMHTRASDGLPTVQQLLTYVARERHLDVLAITDHDTLDASLWAYEQRHLYPFEIVPGVEVTTREGHVLGLWVTQPIPKHMSLKETATAIHEQGGLAVLAHPGEVLIVGMHAWRHLRQPQVLLDAGLDALEVVNAGAITPGHNWLARQINAKAGLPVTGSSDAHTLRGIGCGVTRFPGRSAADLRAAITAGQTLAEGISWPIIDYLKISPVSIRGTLTGFLARSLR
ncbi:MAG: CehA/McbA family metallohydrolase [Chloroflexi bacterium]|nr:CehA/McbA family metallohydrolase [Chloroflexota bacterium]